jgi:hypothetical protein
MAFVIRCNELGSGFSFISSEATALMDPSAGILEHGIHLNRMLESYFAFHMSSF